MKSVTKPSKYLFVSLTAFILLILNVYAVKAFIIFGSPILFAATLLIVVLLILVFVYSLVRSLNTPGNIIKSVLLSGWGGLVGNVYVRKLTKSKSPFIIWAINRLRTGKPYGLPLTITLFVSLFLMVNFIGIAANVFSHGSMTATDARVLNLIPNIRTPTQTTFFRVFTALGNNVTIILVVLTAAVVFWRKNQRLLAGLFVGLAASAEIITHIIKLLVARMRPGEVLSLIRETSYSFPSSHAMRATFLYGLIAYIIYKSYTKTWARILTIVLYFLVVFLVATSRIYLGVHYPTDVWAGILLGSSMLALAIGGLEIFSGYKLNGHKPIDLHNKTVMAVPIFAVVFSIIASPFIVQFRPVLAVPASIPLQKIDETSIKKLPLYSESLTGSRMEPISFIYVGYQDKIESIFAKHGWYKADASTLGNTLRAVAVGFQGGQYLTAPVTPSYLNSKPENVAFEQSTATHSLKQRHHTRLWRTDYALSDGRPIWLATASFDEGVEFSGTAKLPTHHINPNIDAERAYIIKSLDVSGNLVNVVQPQLGKNAGGDSFFTDGKAVLIRLD